MCPFDGQRRRSPFGLAFRAGIQKLEAEDDARDILRLAHRRRCDQHDAELAAGLGREAILPRDGSRIRQVRAELLILSEVGDL